MRKKRKNKKKKKGGKFGSIFGRFFKSIIAVVLISTLILGIFLFVKEISSVDSQGLNGLMSTLFTKIDTNSEKAEKMKGVVVSGERVLLKNDINEKILFKICLISDIHQDKENLLKALEKVKASECRSIIVIGDLTNYGDIPSLKEIRSILDDAGIDYYAVPGDHDLAESVSVENFNAVFGINYYLMEYADTSFLIVDNSPNFTNISSVQMSWIENNIDKVDFVVLSQPVFTEGLNPPFNNIFMGSTATPPEDSGMIKLQLEVKENGKYLLDLIRKSENVKAVFAGEHHRSSELVDPERSGLTHYVIGAVTGTVNDFPQTAIQTSRFSVLSIYESGGYSIEDILID